MHCPVCYGRLSEPLNGPCPRCGAVFDTERTVVDERTGADGGPTAGGPRLDPAAAETAVAGEGSTLVPTPPARVFPASPAPGPSLSPKPPFAGGMDRPPPAVPLVPRAGASDEDSDPSAPTWVPTPRLRDESGQSDPSAPTLIAPLPAGVFADDPDPSTSTRVTWTPLGLPAGDPSAAARVTWTPLVEESDDGYGGPKVADPDAGPSGTAESPFPTTTTFVATRLPGRGDGGEAGAGEGGGGGGGGGTGGQGGPSSTTLDSIPQRSMIAARQPGDALPSADYELHRVLGEGGMGTVWDARQTSVDRFVALKTIKGRAARDRDTRQKFLDEAVITGDLEHPNIVPIHEIGKAADGGLFYSMKQVHGTPWNRVIRGKPVAENLDILLRVADAVAFAHSRGVIHRDLKPQNVMLGNFGEVLVMDWGLAMPVPPFTKLQGGLRPVLGGTPAYMAPEMATGPVSRINWASDVYLLGAILFEIATQKLAHPGKHGSECFRNVVENVLAPTDQTGELMDIAYRAMATQPADRYPSVQDFQGAIREHLAHTESIAMSARAEEDLREGTQADDYAAMSRAIFGFSEALALWDGNAEARTGLSRARRTSAETALRKGDFDLGLSLVDETDPVAVRLRAARDEREARRRRLTAARRVMTAMGAAILVIVTVSSLWIRSERNYALAQRDEAQKQRDEARRQEGRALEQSEIARVQRDRAQRQEQEAIRQGQEATRQARIAGVERDNAMRQEKIALEQRRIAQAALDRALLEEKNAREQRERALEQERIAVRQKQVAEEQRGIADQKRVEADQQRALAVSARESEAYEAYRNRIGLAAAKIDENAFDVAEQQLAACPPELRNWEWGWLHRLCRQATQNFPADGPVAAVAFSPDGRQLATGSWDRKARLWDRVTGALLLELPHGGLYVHSVAYSPDGRLLATGGSGSGWQTALWDTVSGGRITTLAGHRDAVSHVEFSDNGRWLLTTSYDNDARLWDVRDRAGPVLAATLEEHTWWVRGGALCPGFDPAAEGVADTSRAAPGAASRNRIVTVGQDGKILVWKILPASEAGYRAGGWRAQLAGRDLGHAGPVYAVAFHPRGVEVATAGEDRIIRLRSLDSLPAGAEREGNAAPSASSEPPRRAETRLTGHLAAIESLRYSEDGERLISGSRDNTVKVWDLSRGETVKTLRGHSSGVRSVALSPDGRTVASGGTDRRAMVWDTDRYEEMRVLGGGGSERHRDAVLDATFSPDGQRILTASRDRTARVWDRSSGRPLQVFQEGHEYLASRVESFTDGRALVTAAADGTVRLWNASTGAELLRLPHTGRSALLALSFDDRWLVTGDEQDAPQLWDLRTLRREENSGIRPSPSLPAHAPLKGHKVRVTAACFGKGPTDGTAERTVLATGDAAGRCILYHIHEDGIPRFQWSVLHHTLGITDLQFLRDGRLLSSSNDHTVACMDPRTGREIETDNLPHRTPVTALAVSADGLRIATLCERDEERREAEPGAENETARRSSGTRVTLWDATSARSVDTLEVPSISMRSIDFSPDGRWLLVAGEDQTVRRIDLRTPLALPDPVIDLRRRGGIVAAARYTRDGRSIATIGGTDARLWDAETGRENTTFGPQGAVAAARFSPDGRQVLTASWNNPARIWSGETARSVLQFERHTGYVNGVAYSPDGGAVLTVADDGAARIWSVRTGRLERTLTGHTDRVRSAEYSRDGSWILTASNDRTVRLWEARTGQALGLPFEGHTWAVRSARFSPDGQRIVSGSEDHEARIWDIESQKTVAILRGHTAPVTAVVFLNDGRRVATASQDHTVKLWDSTPGREGKEILTLRGHTQEVTSIAVSPDGQDLLTGGRDQIAILWLGESGCGH